MQIKQKNQKLLDCWLYQAYSSPQLAGQNNSNNKEEWSDTLLIDFYNLNKASLKHEFPLHNIEMLFDASTSHSMFSFMDSFNGYNQVKLHPDDAKRQLSEV